MGKHHRLERIMKKPWLQRSHTLHWRPQTDEGERSFEYVPRLFSCSHSSIRRQGFSSRSILWRGFAVTLHASMSKNNERCASVIPEMHAPPVDRNKEPLISSHHREGLSSVSVRGATIVARHLTQTRYEYDTAILVLRGSGTPIFSFPARGAPPPTT